MAAKKPKKRKRTIPCVTCVGTGYYLCNRGVVPCHVCNGSGKVKCPAKLK